jgi:hypothetical protein
MARILSICFHEGRPRRPHDGPARVPLAWPAFGLPQRVPPSQAPFCVVRWVVSAIPQLTIHVVVFANASAASRFSSYNSYKSFSASPRRESSNCVLRLCPVPRDHLQTGRTTKSLMHIKRVAREGHVSDHPLSPSSGFRICGPTAAKPEEDNRRELRRPVADLAQLPLRRNLALFRLPFRPGPLRFCRRLLVTGPRQDGASPGASGR